MAKTVFYSWQMDTPKKVGFNLIEDALHLALRDIQQGLEIDEPVRDVVLDRDTRNVAGQPPIVDTIFRKIDSSSVFVPDLTLVGTRHDGVRAIQNPNVLIEYGYAIKSRGYNRVVAVMNTHFGEPTDAVMPFDMKHLRRPIQFSASPDAPSQERERVKGLLAKELKIALSAVLVAHPVTSDEKPFVPKVSGNSIGRFRPIGMPLGVVFDPMNSGASKMSVSLDEGPVVWFRVYPEFAQSRQFTFSEIQAAARQNLRQIRPFDWIGEMGFLRAKDGFGIRAFHKSAPGNTNFVSFIFTSGEMWACATGIMGAVEFRDRKVIPPMPREFRYCLENYSAFLTTLGVEGPFKWEAGYEGTDGLSIPTDGHFGEGGFSDACLESTVSEQGNYVPGQDPMVALKPFTDKLYDSCGLAPPS